MHRKALLFSITSSHLFRSYTMSVCSHWLPKRDYRSTEQESHQHSPHHWSESLWSPNCLIAVKLEERLTVIQTRSFITQPEQLVGLYWMNNSTTLQLFPALPLELQSHEAGMNRVIQQITSAKSDPTHPCAVCIRAPLRFQQHKTQVHVLFSSRAFITLHKAPAQERERERERETPGSSPLLIIALSEARAPPVDRSRLSWRRASCKTLDLQFIFTSYLSYISPSFPAFLYLIQTTLLSKQSQIASVC